MIDGLEKIGIIFRSHTWHRDSFQNNRWLSRGAQSVQRAIIKSPLFLLRGDKRKPVSSSDLSKSVAKKKHNLFPRSDFSSLRLHHYTNCCYLACWRRGVSRIRSPTRPQQSSVATSSSSRRLLLGGYIQWSHSLSLARNLPLWDAKDRAV